MKTLYFDCGMGAAGDMLTAALLELLPDPEAFLAEFRALGIPGVEIRREAMSKCGIGGTHVTVTVHGEEESEDEEGSGEEESGGVEARSEASEEDSQNEESGDEDSGEDEAAQAEARSEDSEDEEAGENGEEKER